MPSENTNEEQPTGSEPQRPSEQGEQDVVSGVTALIDAYRKEQETNRKQEERDNRGRRFREWATLGFVILTTIGIFIQAIIFNSTDKSAHDASAAAMNAVQATNNAMMLDERAWIGIQSIDPVPLVPKTGEGFGVGVRMKNSGKTPARNILLRGRVDQVGYSIEPAYSYLI